MAGVQHQGQGDHLSSGQLEHTVLPFLQPNQDHGIQLDLLLLRRHLGPLETRSTLAEWEGDICLATANASFTSLISCSVRDRSCSLSYLGSCLTTWIFSEIMGNTYNCNNFY